MTRDIVDGMGTSGTQGVFQRCAEETLRVLRDRSDVIMTVLEVFKHDPLHSWFVSFPHVDLFVSSSSLRTASEMKLKRAQGNSGSTTATDTSRGFGGIGIDMSSGTADEAADRALSSVARKLDKALSVEYTVNELIAEATDPVNLATIFSGAYAYYFPFVNSLKIYFRMGSTSMNPWLIIHNNRITAVPLLNIALHRAVSNTISMQHCRMNQFSDVSNT